MQIFLNFTYNIFFKKFPDPDSKILEQERSRSLKKVTPATSATSTHVQSKQSSDFALRQ